MVELSWGRARNYVAVFGDMTAGWTRPGSRAEILDVEQQIAHFVAHLCQAVQVRAPEWRFFTDKSFLNQFVLGFPRTLQPGSVIEIELNAVLEMLARLRFNFPFGQLCILNSGLFVPTHEIRLDIGCRVRGGAMYMLANKP